MTGAANRRTALLAITGLLAASGGCADTAPGDPSANNPSAAALARTNTAPTTSAAQRAQFRRERPPLRVAATPGLKLGQTRRAEAVGAAQGFAVTLTHWLYGERQRLDVEPVTVEVRRELASSPPYIPPDQRGTGGGRVRRLELALQTGRSGIVTVTINDMRTSYRIPAALKLRGGHWQIVHLNTH
jgi:hypothetical protein